MMSSVFSVGILIFVLLVSGCKTKSEMRREQEFDRLRQEVREAKDTKVDVETNVEELKTEVARLGNVLEQQAQLSRSLSDETQQQVSALTARVQALEQRAVSEELNLKQPPPQPPSNSGQEKPKVTFESGKRLYEEGRYEDAVDIFKAVAKAHPKSEDGKRSQFYIGESYFAAKDYASAALEFAEYRKVYPKDSMVPAAIFKQASAFKNMGKKTEAKLFFQDLIDRYPSHPFSAKAKAEMKQLK